MIFSVLDCYTLTMKSVKFEDDTREIEMIGPLLGAQRVVVITSLSSFLLSSCIINDFPGVGISVAAGLPAFRGPEGLYYARELPYSHGYDGNVEDLFSLPALMVCMLLFFCSQN
jgi:hypothetical protein